MASVPSTVLPITVKTHRLEEVQDLSASTTASPRPLRLKLPYPNPHRHVPLPCITPFHAGEELSSPATQSSNISSVKSIISTHDGTSGHGQLFGGVTQSGNPYT